MAYDACLPQLQLERRFNPNHGKGGKFTSGGGGTPPNGPGSQPVRMSLQQADTNADVGHVFTTEAEALTGRRIIANFAGSDVQISREHAEGVLQGVERFPVSRLERVSTYGPGGSSLSKDHPTAYAFTQHGPFGHNEDEISFNNVYAANPAKYRASLASMARKGWNTTPTPAAVGLHEYGHVITVHGGVPGAAHRIATAAANRAGVGTAAHVTREISEYASTKSVELVAEVFAAAGRPGARMSELSKQIFGAIESDYNQHAHDRAIPGGLLMGDWQVWLEQRRLEVRFNPNHGKGGKFTSGGGKGVSAGGGALKPYDSGGGGGGGGGGPEAVRKSLQNAQTTDEVSAVVSREAGRMARAPVEVDFSGSDVQLAREHGEGVLQGFERFPKAPVRTVGTYGPGSKSSHAARAEREAGHAFAVTDTNGAGVRVGKGLLPGSEILFNNSHSGAGADSAAYRRKLDRPRLEQSVSRTPRGVALHEFGHAVAYTGRGPMRGEVAVYDHMLSTAAKEGYGNAKHPSVKSGQIASHYVATHVSHYASTNYEELSAEVFADVMINGKGASPFSKSAFGVLETEHAGYVSQTYGRSI